MARLYDNTNKLLSNLDSSIKACMLEIGTTGKADLMANCIVDTGTLRKGHFFRLADNGGKTKKVIFANYVKYAPYVEFTMFKHKGDRSWFRKTLRADTKKFNMILQKHLTKGMKL